MTFASTRAILLPGFSPFPVRSSYTCRPGRASLSPSFSAVPRDPLVVFFISRLPCTPPSTPQLHVLILLQAFVSRVSPLPFSRVTSEPLLSALSDLVVAYAPALRREFGDASQLPAAPARSPPTSTIDLDLDLNHLVFRHLAGMGGPPAPELNLNLVANIIRSAGPSSTSFIEVFKAYNDVLQACGLDPADDVVYVVRASLLAANVGLTDCQTCPTPRAAIIVSSSSSARSRAATGASVGRAGFQTRASSPHPRQPDPRPSLMLARASPTAP